MKTFDDLISADTLDWHAIEEAGYSVGRVLKIALENGDDDLAGEASQELVERGSYDVLLPEDAGSHGVAVHWHSETGDRVLSCDLVSPETALQELIKENDEEEILAGTISVVYLD